MGSISSVQKIENEDHQDKDINLCEKITREDLLAYCRLQLENSPSLLKRSFLYLKSDPNCYINKFVNNSGRYDCSCVRVLQWNVLSQALGTNNDKFVRCPDNALEWNRRRFLMLQELVSYSPDIICLQEVDHFDFLKRTLSTQGYNGVFSPKPDSPCIYIKDNNGPDGCAIFYDSKRFTLLTTHTRILQVWKIESNQVAILNVLRDDITGNEFCIATTHLKARKGALLSSLRNEQGKDLLEFIKIHANGRPLILCGDFNAEPSEPVYNTMTSNKGLCLSSAYMYQNKEPSYTTWKIREEGEICHTIDYIFYTPEKLSVNCILKFPTDKEIGEDRIPSLSYPSDHFSLVCDFSFNN